MPRDANLSGRSTDRCMVGGSNKLHTEKFFPKFFNPNQSWIVINILRWIWHQLEFQLLPNLSQNGSYNPNLVSNNKIQKIFLYEYWKISHQKILVTTSHCNPRKVVSDISEAILTWRDSYPHQNTLGNWSNYEDIAT